MSPIVSRPPQIDVSPPMIELSAIAISDREGEKMRPATAARRYLRRQYHSRRRETTSSLAQLLLGAVQRRRRDQPVGEDVDQPAERGDAEDRADDRPEQRPLGTVVEGDEQGRRSEHGDGRRHAPEPPPLVRQGNAVLVDPAAHGRILRRAQALHLIEHPRAGVSACSTALPASTASSAARSQAAFWDGSSWSESGAPRYASRCSESSTNTCGVRSAPSARATSWDSSNAYGIGQSCSRTNCAIRSGESAG